jgi:hypothetical protein
LDGRIARDLEFESEGPVFLTPEEIDRLLTNSPRAKEVTASSSGTNRGNGGGRSSGRSRGTLGIPGIGGIGLPGTGRAGTPGGGGRSGTPRGYPDGGESAPMRYNGLVRWESAQPILYALKTPLPETFANRYVISVSGIPILSESERRLEEDEKSDARRRRAADDAIERLLEPDRTRAKGAAPRYSRV